MRTLNGSTTIYIRSGHGKWHMQHSKEGENVHTLCGKIIDSSKEPETSMGVLLLDGDVCMRCKHVLDTTAPEVTPSPRERAPVGDWVEKNGEYSCSIVTLRHQVPVRYNRRVRVTKLRKHGVSGKIQSVRVQILCERNSYLWVQPANLYAL